MALFDSFGDISWLGVGAAFVFMMILGYVWYAPFLFGKKWMAWVGLDEAKAKEGAGMGIAGSMIAGVLMAVGMGLFVAATGSDGLADGMQVGLAAGVLFAFPFVIIEVFFLQKNKGLLWLNGLHHIIEFTGMGMIIGAL